jgi:hypothetical protein
MTFDSVGTAEADPDWPSVAAMLADVANAFDHGQPVRDHFPVSADGHVRWT